MLTARLASYQLLNLPNYCGLSLKAQNEVKKTERIRSFYEFSFQYLILFAKMEVIGYYVRLYINMAGVNLCLPKFLLLLLLLVLSKGFA